eukprot:Hpha_TRINITY_DN27226_c0_g1::TRINITY_DN27226_c0_g1_i1::g.140715::m.140715
MPSADGSLFSGLRVGGRRGKRPAKNAPPPPPPTVHTAAVQADAASLRPRGPPPPQAPPVRTGGGLSLALLLSVGREAGASMDALDTVNKLPYPPVGSGGAAPLPALASLAELPRPPPEALPEWAPSHLQRQRPPPKWVVDAVGKGGVECDAVQELVDALDRRAAAVAGAEGRAQAAERAASDAAARLEAERQLLEAERCALAAERGKVEERERHRQSEARRVGALALTLLCAAVVGHMGAELCRARATHTATIRCTHAELSDCGQCRYAAAAAQMAQEREAAEARRAARRAAAVAARRGLLSTIDYP